MTTHRRRRARAESSLCYLTFCEALRFTNAALFAEHQGHWLNTLITITWSKMPTFIGRDPDELQHCVRTAIKTLTDAHGGRGMPLSYAWVKELGATCRTGLHVHIYAHLPPPHYRELVADTRERIRVRFDLADCGVQVSDGPWGKPGYRTRKEIKRQLIYAIKGLGPDERISMPSGEKRDLRWYLDMHRAAAAAGLRANIDPVPAPWSTWGKAVGCSNSLGPAAREAAGWNELTTPQDLREAFWQGYSLLNDPAAPPDPWRRLPIMRRSLSGSSSPVRPPVPAAVLAADYGCSRTM